MDARTSDMLEIKQEELDERIALDLRQEYESYTRLLISNIKRAENYINDRNIRLEKEDISLQKELHKILQPFKSMIRFRIPYPESKLNTRVEFSYLNGLLLFKPWWHAALMEVNLIVDASPMPKEYSYIKFKNQLYRFNSVMRVQCYEHKVSARGIDHCYDCRCEVYVFEEYKKQLNSSCDKRIEDYVAELNELFLDADRRYVQMQFDKVNYSVRFTDIQYGKLFEEVLNRCRYKNDGLEREFLFSLLKKEKMKREEKQIVKECYSKYYRPFENRKKYAVKEISDVLISRNKFGSFWFVFKDGFEMIIPCKFLTEEDIGEHKRDGNGWKNEKIIQNSQDEVKLRPDLVKRIDFKRK